MGTVMAGSMLNNGRYEPVSNRVQPDAKTLLQYLVERTGFEKESLLEAALRLLDGKGLTNAGPNLHRRDSTVLQWRSAALHGATRYVASHDVVLRTEQAERVEPSPLESSRTEFGREFLRFCGRF